MRTLAAGILLDAMENESIARDDDWLTAQADEIDGANEQLWRNAVAAGALLGAKYFHERFAPFLDARRLTGEEELERVQAILFRYGGGSEEDRRWKKTLTPLRKHKELGRALENALGS